MTLRQDERLPLTQPFLPFIRRADFGLREPWSPFRRRILDYMLLYVQEGTLIITDSEAAHRIEAGEFALIQPRYIHSIHTEERIIFPFAYMDLFYHPRREESVTVFRGTDLSDYDGLEQPLLNDLPGVHVPLKFTPSQPIRFKETLLRMIALWKKPGLLPQTEAQQLAMELVVQLLRDHMDKRYMENGNGVVSWESMASYMTSYLDEPIRIEELAHRCGLSVSRFSVLFRKKFGLPPHRYLLQQRVRRVQELLSGTDQKLEDIAQQCGFADMRHMTKMFKQAMGCTPKIYRMNSRGGPNE